MRKRRTLIWTILVMIGLLDEGGWAQIVSQEEVVVPRVRALSVGDVIRDCPNCPELIVLPAGSSLMGNEYRWAEAPSHLVTIPQPLAVGRYEVTFSEWSTCVAEGGCEGLRPDGGWGRGNRPVINVSWGDAQSYVHWLSKKTGKPYRLLSEAEWEYAARSGTETSYFWGNSEKREVVCTYANVGPCSRTMPRKGTLPAGSLRPNAFGLFDMIGNVWEWTADCWNRNYDGAPTDGRAWQQGDCQRHVIRGGSWEDTYPEHFTSTFRQEVWSRREENYIGFRVVRSLSVAPNPSWSR